MSHDSVNPCSERDVSSTRGHMNVSFVIAVAMTHGIPFVGFGFFDNFLMILAVSKTVPLFLKHRSPFL